MSSFLAWFHCAHVPQCFHPLIHSGALGLFADAACCEKCCSEHQGADVFSACRFCALQVDANKVEFLDHFRGTQILDTILFVCFKIVSIVFLKQWGSRHSNQQWMRVSCPPTSPLMLFVVVLGHVFPLWCDGRSHCWLDFQWSIWSQKLPGGFSLCFLIVTLPRAHYLLGHVK